MRRGKANAREKNGVEKKKKKVEGLLKNDELGGGDIRTSSNCPKMHDRKRTPRDSDYKDFKSTLNGEEGGESGILNDASNVKSDHNNGERR